MLYQCGGYLIRYKSEFLESCAGRLHSSSKKIDKNVSLLLPIDVTSYFTSEIPSINCL